MSCRIYICNNEADADLVINTLRADSGNTQLAVDKEYFPDIIIYDHTQNVVSPLLLNQNKICVTFSE